MQVALTRVFRNAVMKRVDANLDVSVMSVFGVTVAGRADGSVRILRVF